MNRRQLLKLMSYSPLALLPGCGLLRIDPDHVLLRSDRILSLEQEQQILSKAKVGLTEDGRVRVLYVQGTPYERGYQHGVLLREEVQDNLEYMYRRAIGRYRSKEFFGEAYERLRPFIPQEYVDEMHGLAHGARLPLEVVHHVHALPSMSEWGGKKRIKKILKKMMAGELGTSCSNFGALPGSTADGTMYAVRILDWGLHKISRLHDFPLITVSRTENGATSANIGWVGFLGAISGMNEHGITLGEMGYGSPENETLRGMPMPFMLREVLSRSTNLSEVRQILRESPGTNSFVFIMTDGKTRDAELYVKDRDRFIVATPGTDVQDGDESYPAIQDISYGGHYEERMFQLLQEYRGQLTFELIRDVLIPQMAMKSNFQNVIYAPENLQLWVSYSSGPGVRAFKEPYTFFDLGKALAEFPDKD